MNPRILVAGPERDAYDGSAVCAAALKAAGAAPTISLDAVAVANCEGGGVLPGGLPDIDPAVWGAENRGSCHVDPHLDRMQLRVLETALHLGKPVLGICRGYQLLCVLLGGTLHQDIGVGDYHRFRPGRERVHEVICASGSWAEALYGKTAIIKLLTFS